MLTVRLDVDPGHCDFCFNSVQRRVQYSPDCKIGPCCVGNPGNCSNCGSYQSHRFRRPSDGRWVGACCPETIDLSQTLPRIEESIRSDLQSGGSVSVRSRLPDDQKAKKEAVVVDRIMASDHGDQIVITQNDDRVFLLQPTVRSTISLPLPESVYSPEDFEQDCQDYFDQHSVDRCSLEQFYRWMDAPVSFSILRYQVIRIHENKMTESVRIQPSGGTLYIESASSGYKSLHSNQSGTVDRVQFIEEVCEWVREYQPIYMRSVIESMNHPYKSDDTAMASLRKILNQFGGDLPITCRKIGKSYIGFDDSQETFVHDFLLLDRTEENIQSSTMVPQYSSPDSPDDEHPNVHPNIKKRLKTGSESDNPLQSYNDNREQTLRQSIQYVEDRYPMYLTEVIDHLDHSYANDKTAVVSVRNALFESMNSLPVFLLKLGHTFVLFHKNHTTRPLNGSTLDGLNTLSDESAGR